MNTFVTDAAGFIGNNLLGRLHQDGHENINQTDDNPLFHVLMNVESQQENRFVIPMGFAVG